jgi:ARG and Rhodanese-Phosphatase-superfamily-associated Protein domain
MVNKDPLKAELQTRALEFHVSIKEVKMKGRAFNTGIFLIVFCVALFALMAARGQSKQSQTPPVADYTVSGPYTHKNLTIFLLHGAGQSQNRAPLTLQEAMKRKLVVVRETRDVNRLTIQNRSNQDVFVQAGDIVKGGQQDRVLGLDLIVPPKSGRIPIDAFCVEQGRWSRRGNEAVAAFSTSDNALASKDLKIAAKARRSQGDVWANVSKTQEKLAMNTTVTPSAALAPGRARRGAGSGVGSGHGTGVGAGRGINVAGGSIQVGGGPTTGSDSIGGLTSVTDRASPSSLQLTLENKLVKDTANDYVKNLSSIINGKRDVVGFVFAINGQINSADVYSSNALFAKLWPKMLEASAIEAIAELKAEEKFQPVEAAAVKTFLRESQTGKAETKRVTARMSMVKHETEKNLFFESRDHAKKDKWVHRNYITK